jgi:TrmH family RNA methyltransferase
VSALGYRHKRVQRLRRLIGYRDERHQEGRVVLEGPSLLAEALDARVTVEAVFVDGAWPAAGPGPLGAGTRPSSAPGRQGRVAELLRRSAEAGAQLFELEPGVIGRVAATVAPQPLLAVAEMPAWALAEVAASTALGLVVVCAEIRDPGNLGTVIRSARAAGADAVVCCERTVDPWNPKALRSSAGAALHLPVVVAGAPGEVLEALKSHGLWRWAAVPKGGASYDEADLAQPAALVLGNEAGGLPLGELEGEIDGLLSIPMTAGAESLNVGAAAAVLLFEAGRQRRGQARDPVRPVAAAGASR